MERTGVLKGWVARAVDEVVFWVDVSENEEPTIKAANNKPPTNKNTSNMMISLDIPAAGVRSCPDFFSITMLILLRFLRHQPVVSKSNIYDIYL